METPNYLTIQLAEANNKIVSLEKKIKELEGTIEEKNEYIVEIETNMGTAYVEGWKDVDGGDYWGSIVWAKCNGMIFYRHGTRLDDGEWELNGKIIEGKMCNRNGDVLEEWIDGELVGQEEEEEEEEEEEDDEDDEDDDDDDASGGSPEV